MPYTRAYIIGDSLVDSGNALALAQFYDSLPFAALPDGAPVSELGYFQGRFSNGYTFADLVMNRAIGLVSQPVFPYGYDDPFLGVPLAPWASDPGGTNLNFAYGGAHVIRGDEAVSEMDAQTDALRDAVDGRFDPNALILVTFGGNDVRDLALTGQDPVPQAEAYAQLRDVADKFLRELSQLIGDGAQNIVITGLADVGRIPRYDRDSNGVLDATEQMRSSAATDYSIYLDTLIRTQVVPALQQLLVSRGIDPSKITYVPIMDYVDTAGTQVTGALSANLPMIAALHGLTTDQLLGNWLEYKDLIFFDQVHPNAQAHALLGAYMQAQLSHTPWIETLPLMGANIDYRATGTIGATGEVDRVTVALVAGTTYTLEMLGVSSLGTAGSLADTFISLIGPGGSLVRSDDDSGPGFDSSLTFTAAATGNYTVQLAAVGAVTGGYAFQGAVVSGAAMLSANTYVVNSAVTVILEGEGVGTDIVRASVSYALATGSQVEMLRTTNDKGKGSIDLTGNEFAQSIVGNSGANKIDGKGGADTLFGGGGKDMFFMTTTLGANNVDHLGDFSVRDDTISLSASVFTGMSAGSLASGAFALGSAALQGDDRILYDRASGQVFFDQDGSGTGYAPVLFATVSTGLNLTAADFIVGL